MTAAAAETDRGTALFEELLWIIHVHLLEHLDYEERHAGPTMRRLDHLARR
jgi:hypothetical protein